MRGRGPWGVLLATVAAMSGGCGEHGEPTQPALPPAHVEHAGARARARDRVELSARQMEGLRIRVEKVRAGNADSTIRAPATVVFDPDRVARVGPRLAAKVVRVTCDLGTHVEAGDTLAVLDSVELGRARARYLTAAARLETAKASYEREKHLAADRISSQAELLEARARYLEARAARGAAREELRLYGLTRSATDNVKLGGKEPLSYYHLLAPASGVVQRRDLVPGETIEPDQTPIEVVDTSRLWVWIDAFEQDLPALAPGQRIELVVRALPERTFTGKVDWISGELDEKARTVRLRAVVDNPQGLLRAGMFGTARILTGATASLAMVPVDAVQSMEARKVVFVPDGAPGRFRAVTVDTGRENEGWVELRKGIRPGDEVVVAGAFDLKSALTAARRSAAHTH